MRATNGEIATLLINSGADVNAIDDLGNIALIKATVLGNQDVIEILIQREADVNKKNKQGKTALSITLEEGHPWEGIALFLKKASDKNKH